MKNLLYIGSLAPNGTSFARLQCLKKFFNVSELSNDIEVFGNSRVLRKLENYLPKSRDKGNLKNKIHQFVNKNLIDIVWFDKGTYLTRTFLTSLPQHIKVVNYSEDHIGSYSHSITCEYFDCLDLIDIQITTNESDFVFYKQRNLDVIKQAFSLSGKHVPAITKKEFDIVFIGHYEEYTAFLVKKLAKEFSVSCVGTRWLKLANKISVVPKTLWGQDYYDHIAKSKIGLCVLSKFNLNSMQMRPLEYAYAGIPFTCEQTLDVDRIFKPYISYIPYSNSVSLIENLKKYILDPLFLNKIATNAKLHVGDTMNEIVFGNTVKKVSAKLSL